MECPNCKEIEFRHTDTLHSQFFGECRQDRVTFEYNCNSCDELGYFDAPLPKPEEKT